MFSLAHELIDFATNSNSLSFCSTNVSNWKTTEKQNTSNVGEVEQDHFADLFDGLVYGQVNLFYLNTVQKFAKYQTAIFLNYNHAMKTLLSL